jgi:hypothetical protein
MLSMGEGEIGIQLLQSLNVSLHCSHLISLYI